MIPPLTIIGICQKSEVMGGISKLPLVSMIGIVLSKLNNHDKYVALNLVYFCTLYLKIFAANHQ